MTDRRDDVEFVKQRLSEDPTEEFLEQIAATVVDQMADSFPELSLKSRPMGEALSDFRSDKLEEVKSTGQYIRKLEYLQTYLEDEARVETTEDLTNEDVKRYDKWRKYDSLSRDVPLADTTLKDEISVNRRQFIRSYRPNPLQDVRDMMASIPTFILLAHGPTNIDGSR